MVMAMGFPQKPAIVTTMTPDAIRVRLKFVTLQEKMKIVILPLSALVTRTEMEKLALLASKSEPQVTLAPTAMTPILRLLRVRWLVSRIKAVAIMPSMGLLFEISQVPGVFTNASVLPLRKYPADLGSLVSRNPTGPASAGFCLQTFRQFQASDFNRQ
jgi:hypothetical protein